MRYIGDDAFYRCSGLQSITIPSGVTSIGGYAFCDCSNLESIKVDENNRVYDSRENCNAIIEKSSNKLVIGCKNTKVPSGVTSIGLAIHNFPEGLAIGSGFGASLTLGYSLAIAICIHDIPEGISMAVPMKNGGMKTSKVLYYVILSGVTTGIGALIGKIIGGIFVPVRVIFA